jgi:bacillithiol system protein YtxJ
MKLILKHSPRCPVSIRAKGEVSRFLKNFTESLDFELVDIIENRERSNEIVQETGIEHESPQVILLDDGGNCIWHDSHRSITRERLKTVIEENR